jgi:PTH1 family peptidyl-tRNA hydrolase
MQKEKIPLENILILVDDLALPTGKIRLRSKGGDAGHNGLKSIQQILCTSEYCRLRFGIGDDFPRGHQIDHVLGKWTREEEEIVNSKLERCFEIIKSFATIGIELTMTKYNRGS